MFYWLSNIFIFSLKLDIFDMKNSISTTKCILFYIVIEKLLIFYKRLNRFNINFRQHSDKFSLMYWNTKSFQMPIRFCNYFKKFYWCNSKLIWKCLFVWHLNNLSYHRIVLCNIWEKPFFFKNMFDLIKTFSRNINLRV